MSNLSIGNSENYKSKSITTVKDIFGINIYQGTSSQNGVVITGVDMTTDQSLVKIKDKDSTSGHFFYDTVRGISKELDISKNSESLKSNGITSFNNKGFTVGNSLDINVYGKNYIATTFKKAEKFFDIVQYTGTGTLDRPIAHGLNCAIGLISIKALDVYSDWIVRHKDAVGELSFNNSSAQLNKFNDITEITSTQFKVSNNANLLSVKYIAYLFANNSDYTGKIQCGTYIGGNTLVTNTLTNFGKLVIPETVNEITITCKGGSGGNNIWYDPGQPYIAPTSEQKYEAAVYGWKYVDDYSITNTATISLEKWNSYNHVKPVAPVVQPTRVSDPLDPTSVVYVGWWTGTIDKAVFWSGHYSGYLITEEKPFIASNPGQPYIAPSTGGGIYKGSFSTFNLNEINYSFEGGNGGPAAPVTNVIDLTNSQNRVLTYNIAAGGSLVYSYYYGGDTDITLNYTLPPTKYSTNLTGSGTLVLPQGILAVKLECSGGIGKNDAWTNPGKPYIAPQLEIPQRGLPQYPQGLPPYIATVKGVKGQGTPTFPYGLAAYVAPVAAVPAVVGQGNVNYPNGLPVYKPATLGGVGQQGLPLYPGGLPAFVDAVPAVGNPDFPQGLPPYSAGPPVVGDSRYPSGFPVYVPAKPQVGLYAYPQGLPVYIKGTDPTPEEGNISYPNGLPVYVEDKAAIPGVLQEGLPQYKDGFPYYIEPVIAVVGQGKAAYPEGLEAFIPTIPAVKEQLYEPPSFGGGDVLGESSSFTLNNETFTCPGSFGIKPAQVYIQNIILNGKTVENLLYNIPTTGSLVVSYDIPNYDTTIESTFEPYYLIIKKLTDEGDWYEIDCRDKDHQLFLNKQNPLANNDLIELKKNGFIATSLLVNELNQHYAYLVIRK